MTQSFSSVISSSSFDTVLVFRGVLGSASVSFLYFLYVSALF